MPIVLRAIGVIAASTWLLVACGREQVEVAEEADASVDGNVPQLPPLDAAADGALCGNPPDLFQCSPCPHG